MRSNLNWVFFSGELNVYKKLIFLVNISNNIDFMKKYQKILQKKKNLFENFVEARKTLKA